LGPLIEDHHYLLSRGFYFMPHQRYMADVIEELDPVTGERRYELAVIIIPRQCGKTTLIEAKVTARAEQTPDGQIIYAAQNADRAREKMIDELFDLRLQRNPFYAGHTRARRSNGSAHVRWTNTNTRLFIVPSNDSAADGKTVDEGVLDEAFVYRDLSIVSSVQSTMVTRTDPLLMIVSTVGEGDDGLLMHYQDVGQAAVNDPDSRIAYFEWSAPPEADADDPATWRATIPALGHTMSEERIRAYRQSMPAAQFDRSFLCRRPTVSELAAINLEHWDRATRPAPLPIEPPFAAAVHVHPSRSHTTIAVCGRVDDDQAGVVIDRRPGTGWAVEALEQLVARGARYLAADRVAGAGGIIDRAKGRDVHIDELTGPDVVNHCGTLIDELDQQTVVHQDQPDLTAAVNGSRSRPLGASFAWDQRAADVPLDPLSAATFALGTYRRHWPAGARDDRIT
jgi:hypothetical protein